MNTYLFCIFILIPRLVLSEEGESQNVVNSRAKPSSINGVYIFMYFVIAVLLLYLVVILFMGICNCKPDYSSTTCWEFSFHVFSSAILLIVSILFFVSITKFKKLSSNYYLFSFQNVLGFSFDLNEVFDNISNINDISFKKSTLIKQLAVDYNTTFSAKNSQFRKSFNNLYNHFDTPNIFKYDLKGMDESRKNIISNIFSFADKHEKNLLSVKKVFKSLQENFFNGIYDDSFKDQNHKQIKSYSRNYMDYPFAYITDVCLIALVVVVGITYFFSNKCSKCCFCSFPIYAIAIIIAVLGSSIPLTGSIYYDTYNTCKYYSSSTMSEQIDAIVNDINKVMNNFEYAYEISHEKEEVSILCNNLSSNIIHENYSTIYSHYSFNKEYRNDLKAIVKTIDSKENDLQKMKILFNEITKIDDYIISVMNEIKHVTTLFVKNTKHSKNKIMLSNEIHSSYESSCNSFFTAFNINMIAIFFLLIGLFFMSISVMLRRKSMETNFCFDFDKKSDSSGMEDTRENVRSTNKKNNDPFTLESGKDVEGYIFGFMRLGAPEPVKDYINENNGDLGKGIYIFLDKDQLLSIYKDIYPINKYPVIYLIPVIVHSKGVLNIGNKIDLFSLPDAFEKYNFDSVKFIAKNGCNRLLICNANIIEFGKEIRLQK